MTFSQRLFRGVLRLLPRSLRSDHGDDIEALFHEELASARRRGHWPVVRVWAAVGRRRHEIGIRIALGARSGQVLALVVRQGLLLVAVGLMIGLPAALAASRMLSSLLVGVTETDPATYISVVFVLAITGAVAAWIPARRAAGVDPKLALNDGG